ncbi:MAG: hypothetical protein A2X58_13170 [Nitrospirae bacterium GWC2_56_14]|nr:MAG: hypothetical protein A2X58_13170 [Nitrospirae bacterium GWC2_56_14]
MSLKVLSLRLAGFAFHLTLLAVIVPFLPLIVLCFTVKVLFEALKEKVSTGQSEQVRGVIFIVVLGSLSMAGLSAPLRLVFLAPYLLLGQPAGGLWEKLFIDNDWLVADRMIGILGVTAVGFWCLIDVVWRWRQATQVKNLPTSKINALAPGLVEIRGRVRPAHGDGSDTTVIESTQHPFDYLNLAQRIEPFYVDDGTGRVLVDPRKCRVRAGWLMDFSAVFGVREIVLERRVMRDEKSAATIRTLREGDKVFVIGCAEQNPSAPVDALGAARLVVRPAERTPWHASLWTTIFGSIKPPRGKDIHDVFFLTDAGEARALEQIRQGFVTVLLFAFFWMSASALLVWSTTLQERREHRPESWRPAYWKGPKPHADRNIVDYEQNRQVSRFQKWLATVRPNSYEAIPALMDALTVENSVMKEEATKKLLQLIPGGREEARGAVPHLISNLSWYDAHVKQISIIALGELGPDAAAAVPALIGQMTCEKTNTYEVDCTILRADAAMALGKIGPEASAAIPALVETLSYEDIYVREAADKALRRIRGESAEGLLQ